MQDDQRQPQGTVPGNTLGKHLIVDFHGARHLVEPAGIEQVLQDAAFVCGATVLQVSSHDFGARDGYTAIALLAESHISIHSWPEHGYAAIDIFMCGDMQPELAVDVLRRHFKPAHEQVTILRRGGAVADHPARQDSLAAKG